MKQTYQLSLKIFITIGLPLALTALLFTQLLSPGRAAPVEPPLNPKLEISPQRPLQAELQIVKSVQTDADPVNGLTVFNGDRITYTITIRNQTGSPIPVDPVTDNLQPGVLFGVQCDTVTPGTNCTVNNTVSSIPLPGGGGNATITVTNSVTWGNFSVAGSSTVTLRFTAVVDCLSTGSPVYNSVGVSFGGGSFLNSNQTSTTAQLQSAILNASGRPLLDGPSGCSNEAGGYDQDWGDYDHDGDLDLALATSSSLAVYRNDGGQLGPLNPHHHRAFGARWGDIDNDGTVELVVVGDESTDAKGFKRGVNYIFDNGVFHGPSSTFTTTDVLWRIALADYDQDGDLDIAAASYIDPAQRTKHNVCLLRLYTNDGSGNFSPQECLIGPLTKDSHWEPAEARRSYAVAWADIDGDGDQDLGVVNYNEANHSHASDGLRLGPGDFSIDEVPALATQPSTSLAWTNFDGDGDMDVAFGNENGPLRVYQNTGGLLPATTWSLIWSSPPYTTHSVAWGNIGANLYLAAGNYGQQNHLYQYPGFGTSWWTSNDSRNTTALAWANYDNNGGLDLTAANFNQEIVAYENTGGILDTNPTLLTTQLDPTRSLDWADFDLDGDLDLAVGNDGQPNKIYLNKVQSPPQPADFPMTLGWTAPAAQNSYSVAWNDVDGDGYPDLAAGNYGQVNQLYQNDGGMDSTPIWTSLDASNTRGLAWGDVDGDGDLDLAAANEDQLNTFYRNRFFFKDGGGATKPLGNINDLAWGDYNNDGYPELAIGGVDLEAPGGGFLYLVKNNAGALRFTQNDSIKVDHDGLTAAMYDLAWGDYNHDGYMDLAAAFPAEGEVRLYQNLSGGGGWASAPSLLDTAYALDFVDFQRDGWPDLAVANSPGSSAPTLKIYLNQADSGGYNNFSFLDSVSPAGNLGSGLVYNLRGIDYDNDGDMDLSAVNLQRQSQLFTAYGSFANPRLTGNTLDSFSANSVAWGDYTGDGQIDLLYGGNSVKTRLYRNTGNTGPNFFCLAGSDPVNCPAGPSFDTGGRRTARFGDIDGDGSLDIVDGVPGGQVKIYRSSTVQSIAVAGVTTLAFGDADSDSLLDLLVGGNHGDPHQGYLYFNQRAAPYLSSASTIWPLPTSQATVSLAWADYNNDTHLDFAVGNCDAGLTNSVQLYQNNQDNTFSLVTGTGLPASGYCSRGLSWADYDGNGDPDLAIGNDGAASFIYQNQGTFGGTFGQVWSSGSSASTHALVWGDWNNDGQPDLAMGNHGQPDRVYANFSTTSLTTLLWLWQSAGSYNTTDLAWGDKDGDGDLDLAFSQDGSDMNGIYENGYVSPSHLGSAYAPLPYNPTYLRIKRPGSRDAYLISAQALTNNPIAITYTVFDHSSSPIITSPIPSAYKFEYSLNGGGLWRTATLSGSTTHSGVTHPTGQAATVYWNTAADGAIGDNVLFRISVVENKPAGPVQQALSRAVSPPFRVRGITCVWPADPTITSKVGGVPTSTVGINQQPLTFTGGIGAGTGVMTFTWQFGDGALAVQGQNDITHTYASDGVYTVTLKVTGEPCPTIHEVVATTFITINSSSLPLSTTTGIYLPLILKDDLGTTAINSPAHSTSSGQAPTQITGLSGRMGAGQTTLIWQPNPSSEQVLAYHIYRSSRRGPANFKLLAAVQAHSTSSGQAPVNSYTDPTSACGFMYYVTALNAGGESLPSTTSYFSRSCK